MNKTSEIVNFKKSVILFIISFILLIIIYLYFNYTHKINSGTANKLLNGYVLATTSPQGKDVEIMFSSCVGNDVSGKKVYNDINICFGGEAIQNTGNIGISNRRLDVWDMTSTDNILYFGVMSNFASKRPFVVSIDFKDKKYTDIEYLYFKNLLPTLFGLVVKESQ